MRRVASIPSTCGMTRSSRTTSGAVRSTRSTASPPSTASPTTSMSSWSSRNVRRPWRTTAWSSAIATRMVTRADLEPHPRARRPAASRSSARRRAPSRAPPSRSARAAARASRPRPGRSRRRRRRPSGRGGRCDASSPTAMWSASAWRTALWTASWAMRKTSPSVAPPGRGVAGDLERDVLLVHPAQDAEVLAERRGEALVGERGRTELEDERPQLLHAGARELLDALELDARGVGVAVEERRGGIGGEHDAEEVLRHRVVQLAGDAVALLDDARARGCARRAGRSRSRSRRARRASR